MLLDIETVAYGQGNAIEGDQGFQAYALADEELMTGASYGSDVTVSEVVVYASDGGGWDQRADWNDYEYYYTSEPDTPNTFEGWAEAFKQEAASFAAAHVTGDPNLPVTQQALQAMEALYAAAKLADPATMWPAPNGNWLTQPEFLQSLEHINIIIGIPPNTSFDAYTVVTGSTTDMNTIYIDPNKLFDDIAGFGPVEGINYTIYHEFGHAVIDGEAGWNNPNREAIANEYGQLLADIVGAQYPDDAELNSQPTGTVDRH